MSHSAQRKFCKQVRKLYPHHFNRVNVIDVGSLDINGSNKNLFSRSHYVGIDVIPGKNVDIVGRAHIVMPGIEPVYTGSVAWNPDLKKIVPAPWFDTIISTEALEHDSCLNETLSAMYNKLRKGGLLLITAAGDGRPEHGTSKHFPEASPGTNDYYRNVSNWMFSFILPPELFSAYHLVQINGDMQFYGIKK